MVRFDARRLYVLVRFGPLPRLGLLLAICVWTANLARAQQQDVAAMEYEQEVVAALEDHEAGRFEAARGHFLRAHEVFPNARTLRGLGKVEFELGRFAEARGYLEAALASDVRPLPSDLRDEVSALIERAREAEGEPAPRALEPVPGPRLQPAADTSSVLGPTQPRDQSSPRKWWAWTLGGAALAGASVAAVVLATRDRDPRVRPVMPGAEWTVPNP